MKVSHVPYVSSTQYNDISHVQVIIMKFVPEQFVLVQMKTVESRQGLIYSEKQLLYVGMMNSSDGQKNWCPCSSHFSCVYSWFIYTS